MRKLTAGYGTLAAAIALACGAASAQDEELSEAEREEIERQTEELSERTEQLEEQTEQLDEQTEELAQQNEEREEGRGEIADEQELSERREELVQMAEETLDRIREEEPEAAALYEEAHGWAAFDTTKGGLIVTGAGGSGVAMEKDGSERTFMHLGQAGVGLGAGLENYQLVLLMADEQTYDDFVSGQWDGSISAQASAGEEGVSAEEQFVEGIAAYRVMDTGLMAQADVSGVRFWPSEELNDDVQLAEAEDSGADEAREAADEAGDAVEEAGEEAEDALE